MASRSTLLAAAALLALLCREAPAQEAAPARLDLPDAGATVTIPQRESRGVPGAAGFLRIALGDITGGEVRVTVATKEGERLIDGVALREGGALPFATRGALYTVTVKRLVRRLIGDDRAVLGIAPAPPGMEKAEQARIRAFLAALAKADVVFVSSGSEPTAAELAKGLGTRLDRGDAKAPTLGQFVVHVASRSSDEGEEYQVKGPTGERVGARAWLLDLAATVAARGPVPVGPGEGKPKRIWAEAIEKPGLPNLHRVTSTLYRGGQPTAEGIRELRALGVRRIVNLRAAHSDRDLLEGTGIDYVSIRCHAWHPEKEDVVAFLKAVADETKGPFFVHCQHGADRTGMMMAVYRVVCQGWSKAEAIEEMTGEGFGYHEVWGGLVEYVRDFDAEAVRRKADLPAPKEPPAKAPPR